MAHGKLSPMKLPMTRIPRKRQACRFACWAHRVKDLQRVFTPHASKTSYPLRFSAESICDEQDDLPPTWCEEGMPR